MKTDEVIGGPFPRSVIGQALRVAHGTPERATRSNAAALRSAIDRFDSEERCRAYLEHLRWPNGVRCVRCDDDRSISRIEKRGQFILGEPLDATTTASTLRLRDGKALVTDGPFAETREQLGGFYVVDVPDLDTALAIAARMPTASVGSIEVRPIPNYGG